MRFLLVDQITSLAAATIEGRRTFESTEPLQFEGMRGKRFIAKAAISEAIGQLATWLCLQRSNFTCKPVFLFADRIECGGLVPVGSRVDLAAHIEAMDDQLLRFSGEAKIEGRVVQSIHNCNCHLLPLEELEDPGTTKHRFAALVGPGLHEEDDEPPFDFDSLIDEVIDVTPAGLLVTATKTMRPDEPFYKDHFPRLPVTPIVMLSEMITLVSTHLAHGVDFESVRGGLHCIRDLKIRQFVRPGDRCLVHVTLEGRSEHGMRTLAAVDVGGKCILRGIYEYEYERPEA